MNQDFQQLRAFIVKETARASRIKTVRPKAETANGLTKRIIAFLRERNHFAARINVTGLYDEKLRKYRPSGATIGVPDVVSCVNSVFVAFEIKIGRDCMSEDQKAIASQIKEAGGYHLITRSFEDFTQFYDELTRPPFA